MSILAVRRPRGSLPDMIRAYDPFQVMPLSTRTHYTVFAGESAARTIKALETWIVSDPGRG